MMKDASSSVPLPTSSFNYEPSKILPQDCVRALQTPLRFLKGVGPKRAEQMAGLGLRTIEDLLYHLPFRYEDRRQIKTIGQAIVGREESFIGKLVALQRKFIPSRRRSLLLGTLADGTGSLGLVWYRVPPYIMNGLSKGQELLVHGKVERGTGAEKRIVHPQFTPLEAGDHEEQERILPIYLRPSGIPLSTVRKWVTSALAEYGQFVPSFLPQPVIQRQGSMDLRRAMAQVHQPEKTADLAGLNRFHSDAHRSIIFDEFFYLQLGLGLRRQRRAAGRGICFAKGRRDLTSRMRALLSFALTGAQERVLGEIYQDMQSERSMQRLIQGDVGSGKTIVAWLAALRAIENGYQAVLMAPTELLAEQHFHNLRGFAAALGVSAALLTGSLPAKAKKDVTDALGKGKIAFVVGTHALIQEEVRAPKLGLGIVDEQHRFGVIQRMALQRLPHYSAPSPTMLQPDILLMSATPIPRSLAMVLYGDMEVSSLDEMPPGRTPVSTRLLSERQRARLYEFVRAEVQRGHQAYIVYPLVEASERLDLRDAARMFEELSRGIFVELSVGLIHGKMAAEERDRVMRSFKQGSTQILVATTVIEVGIDVRNATIMVVEHAERFGLSQLHQLRGRVGRGKDPSYCFLLHYGSRDSQGHQRLKVMEKERDGFRIAEADLELRGPGELFGTRQSGVPDFRLANLVRDSRLLLQARREAFAWLAEDPSLQRPESTALREILRHRWGTRLELGSIG